MAARKITTAGFSERSPALPRRTAEKQWRVVSGYRQKNKVTGGGRKQQQIPHPAQTRPVRNDSRNANAHHSGQAARGAVRVSSTAMTGKSSGRRGRQKPQGCTERKPCATQDEQ